MTRFLSCLLLLFLTWATCVTSTCKCCNGRVCQTWQTCEDSNNNCHGELKRARESQESLVVNLKETFHTKLVNLTETIANLNATCQTKLDNLQATCITNITNERSLCKVDRLTLANCSKALAGILTPPPKTWGETFNKFVDGTIVAVSGAWNGLWAPLIHTLMLLVILALLCIGGWCMFRCGVPSTSRAGGQRHRTAAEEDTTPNAMPVRQLAMTTPTHTTPTYNNPRTYTTNLNDLKRDALDGVALANGVENPKSMSIEALIALIRYRQHHDPW